MHPCAIRNLVALFGVTLALASPSRGEDKPSLTLTWEKNWLEIHGKHVPGQSVRVHYLEAYCRPGSTDRDWKETVIGHKTELVSRSDDGTSLKLRCQLKDGVVVTHDIIAGKDDVTFRLVATNPTETPSAAHWAQPCIRVDKFTGHDQSHYVPFCFVFIDGKLTRLPTKPWAEKARYVPGQVYAAPGVDRNDVNPRPLSSLTPSNGLIGCFSGDGKMILASAWEPYQELFQGVGVCVHSDFRIGGLKPGETKRVRGKIYIVPADAAALTERYQQDFPEHQKSK
jgi:hypothetical protein